MCRDTDWYLQRPKDKYTYILYVQYTLKYWITELNIAGRETEIKR